MSREHLRGRETGPRRDEQEIGGFVSVAATSDGPVVDYETVAARFEEALLEKLRHHGVEDAFLEFWVPDADPLKGIVGMVDSARIAGFDRITIRFTSKSVPTNRLGELGERLKDIGEIAVELAGDSGVLKASQLRSTRSPEVQATLARRSKGYWRPGQAQRGSAPAKVAVGTGSEPLSDFGDVAPAYRQAMARALAAPTHEGALASEDGTLLVTVEEGGRVLSALIDPGTHCVAKMRHRGAGRPSERAVLETFCRMAEGVPIVEAADHVGLRVMDALWNDAEAPAAPGIVLPANQPAPFGLALRLARQLHRRYAAGTGHINRVNFYHAEPGQRWRSMDRKERLGAVLTELGHFLRRENRGPADMELHDLAKNRFGIEIRVVIAFADGVPLDDRPGLMRRFEKHLRQSLEPELELIAELVKDKSPLRRLS